METESIPALKNDRRDLEGDVEMPSPTGCSEVFIDIQKNEKELPSTEEAVYLDPGRSGNEEFAREEESEGGGTALPVGGKKEDFSPPRKVPQRLLELESRKPRPPASLEDIESKLKYANLRRQEFMHSWLAKRAKRRSSRVSSDGEEGGPDGGSPATASTEPEARLARLEERLAAAEQKRQDRETQLRMNHAKSAMGRQQAKATADMLAARRAAEVEAGLETREQRAQKRRAALMRKEREKWAAVQERVANLIAQRAETARLDSERAAMLLEIRNKKLAAAQKKRFARLAAERSRAAALSAQARQVAEAVWRRREAEGKRRRERLEAKLARARGRRIEFLRQRGGCRGNCHSHYRRIQWERLSLKLSRCWKHFKRTKKTTVMLARAFSDCLVSRSALKALPFNRIAARITSGATLRAAKALLTRIQRKLFTAAEFKAASQITSVSSASSSSLSVSHLPVGSGSDIESLLRRLSPAERKAPQRPQSTKPRAPQSDSTPDLKQLEGDNGQSSRVEKDPAEGENVGKPESERYPVRVFLCAYMILTHPDAVFTNLEGRREKILAVSAVKLVTKFESLLEMLGRPSGDQRRQGGNESETSNVGEGTGGEQVIGGVRDGSQGGAKFTDRLVAFDAAWVDYLQRFVAWKVCDEQQLEGDLVRMACQLEASMLKRCGDLPVHQMSHDLAAIRTQVRDDHQLLRQRVSHLTGATGVARLEAALQSVREDFASGRLRSPTPLGSPQRRPASLSSAPPSPLNLSPAAAPTLDPSQLSLSLPSFSTSPAPTSTISKAHATQQVTGAARAGGGAKRSLFRFPPVASVVTAAAAPSSIPSMVSTLGTADSSSVNLGVGNHMEGELSSAVAVKPASTGSGLDTCTDENSASDEGKEGLEDSGASCGQVAIGLFEKSKEHARDGEGGEHPEGRMQLLHELLYVTPDELMMEGRGQSGGNNRNVQIVEARGSGLAEKSALEAQVKDVMERAFWDSVRDNLAKEPPDVEHALVLVREIWHDLKALAPAALHAEVDHHLDISNSDLRSMVLEVRSGGDERLKSLLTFCANFILTLGEPVRDESSRIALKNLEKTLAEEQHMTKKSDCRNYAADSIVKGLQFIFGQLREVKSDISRARMASVLPHLQGLSGLDRIRASFASRFGFLSYPTNSRSIAEELAQKIPRTVTWIKTTLDTHMTRFRSDSNALLLIPHISADLSPLLASTSSSASSSPQQSLPSASELRSGRQIQIPPTSAVAASERTFQKLPEGKGGPAWSALESVLGVGIVTLVQRVEGATRDSVAEVLEYDVKRLRTCQEHFQRLLLKATGALLVQQVLISKGISSAESALKSMQSKLEAAVNQDNVSMPLLGSLLASVIAEAEGHAQGFEQSNAPMLKDMMSRLFSRALTPGDVIFEKVAGALSYSMKSFLVFGNGKVGVTLAQAWLKKGGAGFLFSDIVSLTEEVFKVVMVTKKVHGAIYGSLVP